MRVNLQKLDGISKVIDINIFINLSNLSISTHSNG